MQSFLHYGLVACLALLGVWALARLLRRAPAARTATEGDGEEKEAVEGSPSSGVMRAASALDLPRFDYEEDVDVDPTRFGGGAAVAANGNAKALKVVYDDEAESDEPTQQHPFFLVSAMAQSDVGLRRKVNEDSLLVLEKEHLFAVADGMGGHVGGAIASKLAVAALAETISAMRPPALKIEHDPDLPRRAKDVAAAIQQANDAIRARAALDKHLAGMGTTICAAHFAPNKQRLYVGHVGDSRLYRLRAGKLEQLTTDHTMQELGVQGTGAENLSRVVGVYPSIHIDLILAKPLADDLYMLCSDGLTKMVSDREIERLLSRKKHPETLARDLVAKANEQGGADNVTVVLIRVDAPAARAAS